MEIDTENHSHMMEKIPSMPSTPLPLQAISPGRQNQQRLLQSPSLPLGFDQSPSPRKGHQHRVSDASDVKARIAHLNAISQNGSPTRSTSPTKPYATNANHAAIQRAILGREEAETALANLTAQLDSAKARERLVSERVESLMEQITELRNRQRHERSVYEKEIKQSKKTEYKAELAVIKLQEDLREVRNEVEGYKVRSEHEKAEKEKARQEAFERAYVVASMTEELQEVKRRLEVVQQERDAAVATIATKLREEEEREMRKESRHEQEAGDKRKAPMLDFDIPFYDEMDLEDPNCPVEIKYSALEREVDFLRRQIKEDQETIHFMNMQCQFKACPCRMAERDGVRFVHDYEYDAKLRARNAKKRKVEEIEPLLPLPVFKSWQQKRAENKGKEVLRPQIEKAQQKTLTKVNVAAQYSASSPTAETKPIVQEPAAPLPPAAVDPELEKASEHNAVLAEAANVPLPSMKPMEIDPSDDTPEPTAQLEELTQVIIEAGDSSNGFLFSASTMSRQTEQHRAPVPPNNAGTVRMSDDLFDISPPKRHMPPRPSTAMGLLSVESPIRLVPDSPQVYQRSLTPDVDPSAPMTQSTTTRVALNDTSSGCESRQSKPSSRSHVRDPSRGRSPAPQKAVALERESPAPSTFFPVAPFVKNDRTHQDHYEPQSRPHSTQTHYVNTLKEVSTTTTVPLRDETEDSADVSEARSATLPPATPTPFSVPGTPNMTREAALAQIKARRDRARSLNMRKSAEEGSKTPGSAARRGVNINLKERLGTSAGDAKGRDFSHASAPGRI